MRLRKRPIAGCTVIRKRDKVGVRSRRESSNNGENVCTDVMKSRVKLREKQYSRVNCTGVKKC